MSVPLRPAAVLNCDVVSRDSCLRWCCVQCLCHSVQQLSYCDIVFHVCTTLSNSCWCCVLFVCHSIQQLSYCDIVSHVCTTLLNSCSTVMSHLCHSVQQLSKVMLCLICVSLCPSNSCLKLWCCVPCVPFCPTVDLGDVVYNYCATLSSSCLTVTLCLS